MDRGTPQLPATLQAIVSWLRLARTSANRGHELRYA